MPLAIGLNQSIRNLSPAEQDSLQQGDIVLTGDKGDYAVWVLIQADVTTVWKTLTAYEQFPDFLPSVKASRVLERQDNRVLVERKDRRTIGWMPIKVKIVTENVEFPQERIDYRMLEGTLESMQGSWQLTPVEHQDSEPTTLLVQTIVATANLGPVQDYFYDVFKEGLIETMTGLRAAMEQ